MAETSLTPAEKASQRNKMILMALLAFLFIGGLIVWQVRASYANYQKDMDDRLEEIRQIKAAASAPER